MKSNASRVEAGVPRENSVAVLGRALALTARAHPSAAGKVQTSIPGSRTTIGRLLPWARRPASGDVDRVRRWATIGCPVGMVDYGYLRTSRQHLDGQAGMDPETQARALEAAGVDPANVYRDLGLSGTTASTSRAGWRAASLIANA